jgi:hypothetical protein
MHTVKRIGVISAIKIGGIISAMLVVVPIVIFLVLNGIFRFWDVIIPPELLIQTLASTAFWAAIWGGISTGVVVIIYNVSAHYFGGLQVELHIQPTPRQRHEQVDID